jgi:N-formylglutamate amidohydrolase
MNDCFDFHPGTLPLLISVPHDGRQLAAGMAENMTEQALALPDTDWHVTRLYEFAKDLGANVIAARYSRYVVDLNRSASDETLYPNQVATGLCPAQTFAGEPLYKEGFGFDKAARVEEFWQPYHNKLESTLAALCDEFGYVLIWDAHSIRGEVPRLFPGSLPDLNFGTNNGASCGTAIGAALREAIADIADYSTVLDGRFKGGYITRHYGNPTANIHAIQLELAQRSYMNEASTEYDETLSNRLAAEISRVMQVCVKAAGDT